MSQGELFFALKGPHFDGNGYAAQALFQGALAVVVDDPLVAAQLPADSTHLVPDGLAALQQLARHHRRQLNAPVVGLTGSNGKTTTKELLRATLATTYAVWATPGNLNNHIGLPLTLLGATAQHRVLVLEMGDNHRGEIDELCAIAEPTHGLITNIGLDHMGGYSGQVDNIATKLELFDWLRAHDGEAFVNLNDSALTAYNRQHAMVATTFGHAAADVWADGISANLDGLRFRLHARTLSAPLAMSLPLYGRYNLENALAAAAVALSLGVPPEALASGMASYRPSNNRSQVLQRGTQTFVLDAYNANPSSMAAALDDFSELAVTPAAVVLGDMLELGDASAEEHRKLGERLARMLGLRVILVGPEMRAAAQALPATADLHYFPTREAAAAAMATLLSPIRVVLVKGSRGVALEKLLPLQ